MRLSLPLSCMLAMFIGVFVPRLSEATIFSDDFNRPDGPVGNGWTAWEVGTYLENGQLRAGGTNNGGGVHRELSYSLSSPVTFEFDFSSSGTVGWCVQVNTTNPGLVSYDNHQRLVAFMQHEGENGIRYTIGDHIYNYQWLNSSNARPWNGAPVHISGVVYPDLTAEIAIDYLDGGPLALYQWLDHPMDPATVPQGTLFSVGGSGAMGDVYFDNLVVAPEPSTAVLLVTVFVLVPRRRRVMC